MGRPRRRPAAVETLDDSRVRRGAWLTAGQSRWHSRTALMTPGWSFGLTTMRLRSPQQSCHCAFAGQREDWASRFQVLESFAGYLDDQFFCEQQQQVGLQQAAQGLGVAEHASHFNAPIDPRL